MSRTGRQACSSVTMKKLLQTLILTALVATASEMTLTVEQLTKFIKSSIQLKQPDRQVAEYLQHVKLSPRPDNRPLQQLQCPGPCPQTSRSLNDPRPNP